MPSFPDGLADWLSRSPADTVTLLDPDELTDAQQATIAPWFLQAVRAGGGPAGIQAATAHWDATVPGRLDRAIELFRHRAVGLCLGREPAERGAAVVLVYVLRGDTAPFVCWYGYPPTDRLDNCNQGNWPGVKADLTQVSEPLRTFYTRVHNRFRVVGAGEIGLLPLDEWFTLDRGADEYEYEADPGHHPEPDHLLPVFTSVHGVLCVELGTDEAWEQYDETLAYLGDLWPNLNGWVERFTVRRGGGAS